MVCSKRISVNLQFCIEEAISTAVKMISTSEFVDDTRPVTLQLNIMSVLILYHLAPMEISF